MAELRLNRAEPNFGIPRTHHVSMLSVGSRPCAEMKSVGSSYCELTINFRLLGK